MLVCLYYHWKQNSYFSIHVAFSNIHDMTLWIYVFTYYSRSLFLHRRSLDTFYQVVYTYNVISMALYDATVISRNCQMLVYS